MGQKGITQTQLPRPLPRGGTCDVFGEHATHLTGVDDVRAQCGEGDVESQGVTTVGSISPAEKVRVTEAGAQNEETEVQKVHANRLRRHG